MRLRLLLPLLALLIFSTAHGQSWVKTFGSSDYEEGYNIYPTADGGFMTAGIQLISPTETHLWVARCTSDGTLLWDRTYGDTGTTYTLFGSGTTRAGGLMFGGFTGRQFSGSEEAVAYCIDSLGNQLWFKGVDYSRSDHFHSMIERKEGGYYLAGHTDSKSDPNGDMWLLKLDSARNIIWEREYDHNYGEHTHWAIETKDGGALLFGHGQIDIHEKFWLVKVDSNGTKQWDSMYSSDVNFHDSPYHVFETREGNYAMVGGSSSDEGLQGTMWLLVVDTTGHVVVDHHYSPSGGSAFAWSGRQTTDGGYVLAGYALNLNRGDRDMYVVKADSTGAEMWTKQIGVAASDEDGYDVIETSDAYIASGSIYTQNNSGGSGDMLVAKIAKSDVEAPAIPQLLSPANNSTGLATTTTLTWSASAGAATYTVEIAEDSAFTTPVSYQTPDNGSSTASYNPAGLVDGRRYWWHVAATGQGGSSIYSETWSFVVGQQSGVEDKDRSGALNLATLSPNPATAQTGLSLNLATATRIEVQIADPSGRVVSSLAPASLQAGSHLLPIDTRGMAGGVYICTVTSIGTDGSKHTRALPLVIER